VGRPILAAWVPSGPFVKRFSYDGKRLFDKPGTAKLKGEKSLNEAGKFPQEN
jgi:hypothetical protein